jgi:hypothetical protein
MYYIKQARKFKTLAKLYKVYHSFSNNLALFKAEL